MYKVKQGVQLPKHFQKGDQLIVLSEETSQEELAQFWEDEGIRMYLDKQENGQESIATSPDGGEGETQENGASSRSRKRRDIS